MLIEKHLENENNIGQFLCWCTQMYLNGSQCYVAVAHAWWNQILLALNVSISLFKNISVKQFIQNEGGEMVEMSPFLLSWEKILV